MVKQKEIKEEMSEREEARYGLSILTLLSPSVIIAIIALAVESKLVAVGVIAFLLLLQFALLKNFLDDYYGL
jgi:hypothetical protein